jgi:hypothetical protein
MSIYSDRLKRMNKTAKEQMEDYTPGRFTLLPEGEYQARVHPSLGETKNPTRLTVFWTFTVTEGDRIGKEVIERNIIEGGADDGKTAKQICRGHIEDLGFQWPEEMEGLEEVLGKISSNPPLVTIQVTHKTSEGKGKNEGKTFTNANVRLIDVLETSGNLSAPTDESPAPILVESDDLNHSRLLALCGAYQLDYITDDMDVPAIVAALKENDVKFKETDLYPEEQELLETVDASLIEWKPKPLISKRTVASAPAKAKPPIKGRR